MLLGSAILASVLRHATHVNIKIAQFTAHHYVYTLMATVYCRHCYSSLEEYKVVEK